MSETIIRIPGKLVASEYGTKLANFSDLDNNVYGPYVSVAAAHTALSANGLNTVGTTVGISGLYNTVVEYWYQGGTEQANLIKKVLGSNERDAVSFDGFIPPEPVTIIEGSTSEPDAILYSRNANRFVAKKGNNYYDNWEERVLYNNGNEPYTSKLYPYNGKSYTWNGTTFEAEGAEAVRFEAQTLTNVQKQQARENIGALDASLRGQSNGVAALGDDGKVPSSQLPSYVDDVLEGYMSDDDLREIPLINVNDSYRAGFIGKYDNKIYRFTQDYTGTGTITDYMELVPVFPNVGESGKIYSDIITNKTYRWSGSQYTAIMGDLVLGETTGTAYDGKKGADLAEEVSDIQDAIEDLPTIRTAAENAYQLPENGIPQEDLSQTVQSSLNQASKAVQFEAQNLNDSQKVIAQNNMMGKAYAPAQFSGLGKKILTKNIQQVSGVSKNVMTQAFFQDSQSQPLTNTIFVIQYDYTLTSDITLPAGSTLLFDGGSISGDGQQRTITCNATTIQAAPLHIFDNVVLAGTVTADLCLNNFVHSRDCVTSAGNVGRAIHVVGRCVIDEPMSVTTGFNIYGDDMYKTRIVLDSSYSGTIKSIFIFDPSTNTVNYTSFKNFGVSAIDYVFYRKQTTATSGSFQVADFHNLYFDSIVKSTFHLECYGMGCVSIKNCYFIGSTTTKPHIYFYGHWFNNNTFENCRVGGNCGGFLKATAIQTSGNYGEMNQNSFVGNWFELITLTSDAAALVDMNSQYNFHVLNVERNYFERIYKSNGSTLATLYQLTANSAIVRNVSWKSNLTVSTFENLILYNSGAVGLEISGNGPNSAPQTITSSVNVLLDVTEIDNGFTITYNSSNVSVNKVENLPTLTKFAGKMNHQLYINEIINTGQYKDYNIIPSDLRDKVIWWSDVQIVVNAGYLITGKILYHGGNYYWVKTFSYINDVTVVGIDLAGNVRITNNTSSNCEIRLASIAMTI